MNFLVNKNIYKIVFWLWFVFIAVVSSLPNIPTQKVNIWDEPFRLDYLEHFGVFAILGGIFVLWKADEKAHFCIKNHLIFVLGLLLFGTLDELHQLWIPGRSYNPLDLIYNLLGLIAGVLFTKYALPKVTDYLTKRK